MTFAFLACLRRSNDHLTCKIADGRLQFRLSATKMGLRRAGAGI